METTTDPTRASFRWPAHPHDRFSPTIAEQMVGQAFPLILPSGDRARARVVAAEVIENGRALEITFSTEERIDLGPTGVDMLGAAHVEALSTRGG